MSTAPASTITKVCHLLLPVDVRCQADLFPSSGLNNLQDLYPDEHEDTPGLDNSFNDYEASCYHHFVPDG